ncbi:MAG TPA: ABC transporter permease [Acidimicrobiales bacterium]|nr:ABC transporter permease [Acidimicrobiales bacterium]
MATVSEIVVSAADPVAPKAPLRAERPKTARVVSARASLRHRLRELLGSRELLWFLVRKELKVKYKNSVLGFAWSMLNPALVLAVYDVVFSVFLKNGINHFVLFLFSGLLAWNLFNNALMGASGAIVNNGAIVKKVAFPREILALSQVGTACVFFLFQAAVFVLFLFGFQWNPTWTYMPLIPLALVALIIFTSAFAIFLSAVNVYLRDTQHLIEVALMAWFWGAPVVYAFGNVYPRLYSHRLFEIPGTHVSWLYLSDPLAIVVLTFQRALYGFKAVAGIALPPGAKVPSGLQQCVGNSHLYCNYIVQPFPFVFYLVGLLIILAVSVVLFLAAMALFGRVEGNFAEEL